MEGPPLGPGGEDITWPDQVAPRGRKASSTRKIKPQTSNLKPSEPGAESEVAHKWARWLHNPYRLGESHRFSAGGRIKGGPQVGKVG